MIRGFNRFQVFQLLVLLLLTWGIRAYYVENTVINGPLRADASQYFASACNLVKHNVYSSEFTRERAPEPDAVRAPGYPLFLVPFIKSSNRFDVIQKRALHTQALLDSITVMLIFFIAYSFLPFQAAFGSALLAALNPHVVVMCAYLLSETLYTFLLAAGMLFLVLAVKKQRDIFYLAAGLLLGAAALTRPALFLFPFLALPLVAVITGRKNRAFFKSGLVMLAAFIIIQMPWIIRNTGIQPPPGKDVSILRASFVHGSYPNFTYRSQKYYGYPYREDPRYEEMAASWGKTFEILGDRIAREPFRHLFWFSGGKVMALWQWDMRAGGTGDLYTYPHQKDGFRESVLLKNIRSLYRLLYPVILLAGLFGFVYYFKGRKWRDPSAVAFLPALILLLYFAALHTVLAPFPRYSIPLRPYIIVLAVYGAWAAMKRFTGNNSN